MASSAVHAHAETAVFPAAQSCKAEALSPPPGAALLLHGGALDSVCSELPSGADHTRMKLSPAAPRRADMASSAVQSPATASAAPLLKADDPEMPPLERPRGRRGGKKRRRSNKPRHYLGAAAPSSGRKIYFERQKRQFCALHSVNNALQTRLLTEPDMRAQQAFWEEHWGARGYPADTFGTPDGYWDTNVVLRALQAHGLKLRKFHFTAVSDLAAVTAEHLLVVIQAPRQPAAHTVAICGPRKLLLDSRAKTYLELTEANLAKRYVVWATLLRVYAIEQERGPAAQSS